MMAVRDQPPSVLLLIGIPPATVFEITLIAVAAGLILCLFVVPDGPDRP
jgi:hypothetical protein